MNSSPKKHRGTFRPINTLSSSEKPTFKDPSVNHGSSPPRAKSTDINSSKKPIQSSLLESKDESDLPIIDEDDSYQSVADRSGTELLGNSSLFFDEGQTGKHYNTSEVLSKMVREREPPGSTPRREAPISQPLQDLTNNPPEYGKASPLRNPLKRDTHKDPYAHLFNAPKPGQKRPEHHRPATQDPVPPTFHTANAPRTDIPRHIATGSGNRNGPPRIQNGSQPSDQSEHQSYHPFKRDPPQVGSRYSTASSADSDIVEIMASQFNAHQPLQGVPLPRPMNPPMQSIQPVPRPMYSSLGHSDGFLPINHGFRPINPLHDSRKTIILDDMDPKRANAEDDDDNFDPDAAIRAESYQFGAPDPYAFVDHAKANENIKDLLEGAFDDDEDKIPRIRGRKKKRQQQEEDEATNALARKLKALEVKKDTRPEKEEEDEEDDGSVEGMRVKLLPHQVDGVSWMIEKETGAHNKKGKLPKGGILADDMGLGKTIQSIALILSNPRPLKDAEPENKKNKILPVVGKGTLIVAPLALIKQWESEINTKVTKSHSLKVLVHHGSSRTKSVEKLKTYDVVVTTYQVLASEHASCGDGPDGLKKGCFGVHWYRIILDEAHTIKNRNAKMTKACYDARSHYRWCLTGTPMQNNLDELQSLIKFLRIQPYCEMGAWKDSITGPMKNGRGNLAMRRLQIFLKAFMKRRTKDILKKEGALNFGGKAKEGEEKGGFQIVARNIETVIGEFTANERAFYDRLSNRAESRLAEMMGGEKADYIGALVLLLRLRQACNHPSLTKSNVKDDKDALTTGSKGNAQSSTQTSHKEQNADVDDLADLLGGMSVQTKRCDICQQALTKETAVASAIRCSDCENDLNVSQKKSREHRKHRKHKHKDRKHKKHDNAKEKESTRISPPSKLSRQRHVILDSDDENEGAGEWIVSGDEQNVSNLGKAGGTDDENAEGGGDWLESEDSDSFATEDEGMPSKKKQEDSFIVHDTDSEDDGPVVRKKMPKTSKVVGPSSNDETDPETESDAEDSDSEVDSEGSETEESDIEYNASELTPSTKIRQLLSILEKETPDHKIIVFSQFTSMLDLIEPFLRREGYNFTRYDGKMRNDLREASLHKLRNDRRTRVLLCSLKCGSLGLNLTAASRVVIMEPFWNPFVEEQAIDRVHRLNQTVDVTVYRLSIHDSVEERILELQEAKRRLAEAAIEGGKAIGKLSMKDILALFKRDAEFDHQHVDDGSDRTIFARTRVLESPVKGAVGMLDRSERTDSQPRKKVGSLGFRKVEDSIWGRR
ncbi:hypothetical protein CC78DRAFT_534566 [Lojkania enalia]|uniref:Uncharacterized protein n=1 Tax=Lojkania enalia TaxID=147567 RepID=A0A9P4N1S8_9PLEO|nr:hypothetical protein CC78DRAFT_534566 [Didymosphaeria enalia]